jgi:hypothetical protein
MAALTYKDPHQLKPRARKNTPMYLLAPEQASSMKQKLIEPLVFRAHGGWSVSAQRAPTA